MRAGEQPRRVPQAWVADGVAGDLDDEDGGAVHHHHLAGGLDADRYGLTRRVEGNAPIVFSGETDRVYLGTTATATVVDPLLGRRIAIAKRGSRSTVLWNPWIAKAAKMADYGDHEWSGMVCVETANAVDDRMTIAPGASERMALEVSVSHA